MTNRADDTPHDFRADIDGVHQIESVPTILDVVCRTTGMRFAAVARVTEDRWIVCSVLDQINFGLKPGGELKIETTICNEIRQSRHSVVIDNVAEDACWSGHPTPAMYGFQSYISIPIILSDGSFWGTLCAIDPRPVRLNTPETVGMFQLFAELIAKNLDNVHKLAETETALLNERTEGELREQFIAVIGHDLRTPIRAINCFAELLEKKSLPDPESVGMTRIIRESASRMTALIDNLLDFARGRLGGGLTLNRDASAPLEPALREVIAELVAGNPGRPVEATFRLIEPIHCDRVRIAQLLSNILANALIYGSKDEPVHVRGMSSAQSFELSVSNSGKPIPQPAMERLFHPFYRSAILQDREGLGLGLYIAHEIATAHGGTLSVESTLEKTCFTFRMPLQSAPAEAC